MENKKIFFISITLLISLVINSYLNKSVHQISDVEKCPFCYGLDYCNSPFFLNATLNRNSMLAVFNNFLSSKNVFTTTDNVVLKKLASNFELEEFDNSCDINRKIETSEIVKYLNESDKEQVNNFRVCGGVNKFFRYLMELKLYGTSLSDHYKHMWTMLHINVEPIILQILKEEEHWPVPSYSGACGRIIGQQHCGSNLNKYKDHKWLDRAYLAVQLVIAAFNFTESHKDFRFYLTDMSPDNIAVDESQRVKFIDLENVIITDKRSDDINIHTSESYNQEDYAYSEQDICDSSISDHNYFTTCKLLLSKNAPWPMMENGLLHSIPDYVQRDHPNIHELIENCVQPNSGNNRFNISRILLNKLHEILHQYNYTYKMTWLRH